ncbi:MAG: SirA-like protein [Syntrophaceae bacterium PtaU1.Bin231]|nr:MAG: SirA-like protein [Syntrophaceae bacterium PtaU1.Bin231]HOG16246.1 sulfurtransferase-like selenium metabolism protein YedF [Syntrophales bacterium]
MTKDIELVDARGLGCPQPVILAKKAIERNDRIVVLVDNETAVENVKRMGTKNGCDVQIEKRQDGTFALTLSKVRGGAQVEGTVPPPCGAETSGLGPFVVVFSENRMGRGNEELGYVLIRAFIHTLCQQEMKPDTVIFYNSGVKLAVKDSEVLGDLRELCDGGVEMLICGTCANYFGITGEIGVGKISNMYDIVDLMSRAQRLVMP